MLLVLGVDVDMQRRPIQLSNATVSPTRSRTGHVRLMHYAFCRFFWLSQVRSTSKTWASYYTLQDPPRNSRDSQVS